MAGLEKNVASQKWVVFAFDRTDNTPKTGDAANITGKIALDWGARNAITDTNPTEQEDGFYAFDLSQAETNGDVLNIYPESSTADIQVVGVPATIFTIPGDWRSQWDGTGLSGDTYPATQAQLNNISTGSAAINTTANANTTVTTGTQTLTYTATHELDLTYHEIAPNPTIEMYYEFDIGANSAPVSALWQGYVTTINDNVEVYAYNWVGTAWEQVGAIIGTISTARRDQIFNFTAAHVGTGTDSGKVRLQFTSDGADVATNLATDQILCSYTNVNQSVGYANGSLWYDDTAANTNTVPFVDGTADNPVSTWAAITTLITSTGLKRIEIANGSTVTFVANSDNLILSGKQWTLNLGTQSCDDTVIEGANVTGACTGDTIFYDCSLAHGGGALVASGIEAHNCAIAGDITMFAANTYFFDQCYSAIAGTATPSIDFGNNADDKNLNFRHYSGGIEFKNIGTGGSTDNISLEGWGQFIINANCTSGVLAIRGHFKKTDNTNGNITIDDNVNFMSSVITAGYAQGSGTGNNQIQLALTASTTAGAYDPSEIFIVSGTGAGQTRQIIEYAADRTATVDRNWKVNPDTTSEYRIAGSAGREHVNEGLAQGGTKCCITLNALASSEDGAYNRQVIFIRSGTGEDQARIVKSYNGTTKIVTVDRDWDVTPDTTSGYVMLPTGLQLDGELQSAIAKINSINVDRLDRSTERRGNR